MTLALEKYGSGKFTLAALLQPAIDLARNGVVLTDDSADTLPRWHNRLARWPSSARIFSRPDGTTLREGDHLVQSDLAATLSAIGLKLPGGVTAESEEQPNAAAAKSRGRTFEIRTAQSVLVRLETRRIA